jgi:hypothetical protein
MFLDRFATLKSLMEGQDLQIREEEDFEPGTEGMPLDGL